MAQFVLLKRTAYHSTDGSIIDEKLSSYVSSDHRVYARRKANIMMICEYDRLLKYIEKRRFLDETKSIVLDSKSINTDRSRAFINFRESSRVRGKNIMPNYLYTSVEWILIPTKFLEFDDNGKVYTL